MVTRSSMKKILMRLLVGSIMFASMPLMAWKWDYGEDNGGIVIYGIDFDEDVEAMPSVIDIPATIDGMPVTGIGDWSFDRCTELTKVTIPDSVTSIGVSAFGNCSALTSVTIKDGTMDPDGMTSIGDGAFANCVELTAMEFGNKVTCVGDNAFANCRKLSKVKLPDSVISIGDLAFSLCGLKEITFGDGVTRIGAMSFSHCNGLTDVTIPGNVEHIGDNAFSECSGLKSVSMGDGVASIGNFAFSPCRSLESTTMPDSVTSIGENAFYGCVKLKKVVLPRSLTTVSDHVFDSCISLKEVVFHEDIANIGEGAFLASGVTNIDLQATKIVEIGKETFKSCMYLTKITLPATVKHLADEAFFNLGTGEHPALIVFRGLPPSCGEKVFEQDDYFLSGYYGQQIAQRRADNSVSHTVFGAYMPEDKSANADAWRKVIDDWGRWNEVQMVMDVKPIACDYTTSNCGELNISWQAFPAYTNDNQKEFWSVNVVEGDANIYEDTYWSFIDWTGNVDLGKILFGGYDSIEKLDELYLKGNYLVLSQMKYSIWRSSEDPDVPYDDFSCASNIAQHVGGEFSTAKGFSATNFIDKTFGKFKGTKPVKYWVEIEDPDDPDNLRYLSDEGTKSITRIRPIVEPDWCVTRRRFGVSVGVSLFNNNAPDYRNKSLEALSQFAQEAALFAEMLRGNKSRQERGFIYPNDAQFEELKFLTNDNATTNKFSAALKDFICDAEGKRHTLPGDLLFLFVSTHGATDGIMTAFDLHDGQYNDGRFRDDLKYFDEQSGVKVIGVLPICHAEGMLSSLSAGGMPKNMSWILAAKQSEDSALINTRDMYGQFSTFFLLHGWKEHQADRNFIPHAETMQNINVGVRDGVITALELARYTSALAIGRSDRKPATVCTVPENSPLLESTVLAIGKPSDWDDLAEPLGKIGYFNVQHDDGIQVVWQSDPRADCYLLRYVQSNDAHWMIISGDPYYRPGLKLDRIWAHWDNHRWYPLVPNQDAWFQMRSINAGGSGEPTAWKKDPYTQWSNDGNPSPDTPDPATPDPVTPTPATPDPVTPDLVKPDPATPEPAGPGYDVIEADDITAPFEAPKAVALQGAAYDGNGAVVGIVELKLGKVNAKKGTGKVSGTFTGLDGKKITMKAANVTGIDGTAAAKVSLAAKNLGTLDVTIGGTRFAGSLGGWHVQSAAVGGAWTGRSATVELDADNVSMFAGEVLSDLLPDGEKATVNNGKWAFAKAAGVKWAKPKKGAEPPEIYDEASGKGLVVDDAKGKTNLSGLKLAYTPKTGIFKGSFKLYALEGSGKATKLKKYSVTVTGVVVDGAGSGKAICKKPAASWPVSVR